MTERQFQWGLSNGVMVLAVAGVFWLGLAFGPHLGRALGALLWMSAAYILWRADRIVHAAVRERWRT